jgi:hypothetical protein
MDKLKLKLESARNGKSWDDIESDGNNQVSEFYTFHGFLHHSNLTSLFLLFLVFYQNIDLMKSYILKIQQLEGELMRQKFSTACRNATHNQLTMENDIFLNDLDSGCEVITPDASSKPLKHIGTISSKHFTAA